VRFAFAPNTLAAVGYVVSAVTGIACLLLVIGVALLAARRRERVATPAEPVEFPASKRADVPWRPERAIAVALLAGVAFGFVFGIAAGVVSVPVLAVILWRGIGAATLTLVAGALLAIVVPVLYVIHHGNESGGNHYSFAVQHMAAHWVGVAAIGLLIVALWRSLSGVRPGRLSGRVRRSPAGQTDQPGAAAVGQAR